MELFKIAKNVKLQKEIDKKTEFIKKGYSIEIISACDESTDLDKLFNIKILFERMLPKMPKEYILRQMLDKKQCCIVLYDSYSEIIGAICYRPAFDRKLVEIVFFAINSINHIKGYGSFLMNCAKELIKRQFIRFCENKDEFLKNNVKITDINFMIDENAEYNTDMYGIAEDNVRKRQKQIDFYKNETNLYLLTYADNSAVGFFKKQGFEIGTVSSGWKKYIKDYDGGSLMECKLSKEINYLNQMELILNLNDKMFEKMKMVNEYHLLRERDDLTFLNLEKDNFKQSKQGFLNNFLDFFIAELYSNPSSWPFLAPVSPKDVPDYFSVIKSPMDLSTIRKTHEQGGYTTFSEFESDVMLMVNNCKLFNGKHTQYYKCAEHITEKFISIINRHKTTIDHYQHL